MSGVHPSGLIAAPRATSFLTIASCPPIAATMIALSPKRFLALTLAPPRKSTSRVATYPRRAATSSAGSPFRSTVFGSIPRANSAATSSARSAATAILKQSKSAWAWSAVGAAQEISIASSAVSSVPQPRRRDPSVSVTRDPEQAKEVARRHRGDLFQWHVAKTGDFFGDITDVRGLVELAAKRQRRQGRRIGLDQHPVERYAPRDILDLLRILESDNAGKGNVKSQIEGALGDLPALGEAVHDASHLGRPFLTHDRERIGGGRAGMDHQRHAA